MLTVEFFESELLGFADKAKDHAPRDQVQTCVEAKGSGGCHGGGHTRECQTENTSYS